MNTRALTLAAALLVASAATAGAQLPTNPGGLEPSPENPPTRQGTRGANFLEIGVGARGSAMAGAVASLVDGPEAWYWNPAGAAALEGFAATATRQNLYDDFDVSQDFFAIGLPALGGVFGVHFNSLNSGDIPRATEDEPFGDPVLGNTFEWTSTAIGLGYARRLTDRLDLGVNAKYISEGINDASINWVGLDFGTQFRTGIYGLIIGASLQNIGPSSTTRGKIIERLIETDEFSPQDTRVNLKTRELELPTLFRFSVGTDLYGRTGSLLGQGDGRHLLLGELAFNDAIDTDVQMATGLEYSFANLAFARVGKRFYNDDRAQGGNSGTYGLSGGLGLRLPIGNERHVRFDYAYTALGELQNVQIFSFEFGR